MSRSSTVAPEPMPETRRPLSRAYDPLIDAVGRTPAKVHTKLLVAFLGTSILFVAVGLLGLRVLGQSNDRVGTLGGLQERDYAYAQLQRDAAEASPSWRRTWRGSSPRCGQGSHGIAA